MISIKIDNCMLLLLFAGFVVILIVSTSLSTNFFNISFIDCFMQSYHPANQKCNRDAQADCGLI